MSGEGKAEAIGFSDGLDVEYKRKKNEYKVFSLNNWQGTAVINWDERLWVEQIQDVGDNQDFYLNTLSLRCPLIIQVDGHQVVDYMTPLIQAVSTLIKGKYAN